MNKQSTRTHVGNTGKTRILPAYLRYPIPSFIYDAIEVKIIPTYDTKDVKTGYGAAAPRVSLEECNYAKTSPC
jgi:hypothetical protein